MRIDMVSWMHNGVLIVLIVLINSLLGNTRSYP
jgi:hypothetical protein